MLSAIDAEHTGVTHELLDNKVKQLFANNDTQAPNPIQLMTVHKSKGLEFDHVILPGLDKRSIANSKQLLIWHEYVDNEGIPQLLLAPIHQTKTTESMYSFIHNKEQTKVNLELTRLIYVAATRSKKSLYLFASLKTDVNGEIKPPEKKSLLSLLWPTCERNFLAGIMETVDTKTDIVAPEKVDHCSYRLPLSTLNITEPKRLPYELNAGNRPELSLNNQDKPALIGTVIHQILVQLATLGSDWWHHFNIKQQQASKLVLGT